MLRLLGLLACLAIAVAVGCGPSGRTEPAPAAPAADTRPVGSGSATPSDGGPAGQGAGTASRPLRQVRITVPTKSITFLPFYFGQDKGLYSAEGLTLDLVQM